MFGSKFNIGEKVVYNGTEAPKIPAMVIDIDFVRGFYTLQTEKRGRMLVDFKHESQIEKINEMDEKRKFKVGDVVVMVHNPNATYTITEVCNRDGQYYLNYGHSDVIAFENEALWELAEETHDDEEALIGRYERLANDYLSEFVRMTGIQDNAPFWVGDDIGSVACIGDYFVDYQTIRYTVDGKISFDEFDDWYCYCNEVKMVDDTLPTPTLEQWYNGDFMRISDERLEEMKNLKKRLEELVEKEKKKND